MEPDHPERDQLISQITWTISHAKRSVLVLYGPSGSGKSLVCQSVYNKFAQPTSSLPHTRTRTPGQAVVYVSAKTATGGSSSDPLTESVFAGAVCSSLHAQGVRDLAQCQRTCSTMRQLVRHIRSGLDSETPLRDLVAIVDDADVALPPAMLVDPSAAGSSKAYNVVSMIARLPEMLCDSCGAEVNLSILVSVREVPLCLRTVPGVVLFPLAPYTVDQIISIAARTLCDSGLASGNTTTTTTKDSLRQYAELVHSMFNQSLTGDVKKLLALCLKYRALYESCEAASTSLSACRALFTTKIAKMRSEEHKKSADCGLVGLSDEAKKLLIASYIASHTTPSHDSFFTTGLKGSAGTKKRRGKTSSGGGGGGQQQQQQQSQHHLSFEARSFPIRRMICLKLALFPREEDDDEEDRASSEALPSFAQNSLGTSTLEQVRELVDQHLLVVTKSQKTVVGGAGGGGGSAGSGAGGGGGGSDRSGAGGGGSVGQSSFISSGSGQLLASLSLSQTVECLVSRAVIAQVALSLTPPLHIEDCF